MRHQFRPGSIGLMAVLASLAAFAAPAQTIVATAAGSVALEADPWPRQVALGDASVTLYPPQVESWDGNRIRFRAAVTLTPTGAGQDSVGVVWASAVTHVDRASRLVSLDDVTLSRATFPTLADGGDAYLKSLQTYFERAPQTIALDRLQSSLAAAPEFKPRAVAVQNVPPRVFVSDAPAILVPISGQPVLRAVPGTSFERVINTRMLILRDARGWYLRLYDGWMTADSIDGRWYPAEHVPSGVDRIAQTVVASGQADLLGGGAAQPRPSLRNGAPSVYVSFTPAALIVFDGPPDLQPIAGTALMWAANSTAHVVVDIVSGTYYTLLAGRWFRSTTLNGPWTFVAARALPGDFSKIPPTEPAAAVLAAVAGTPQAKEALIESAIPQTATVPRTNGPVFAPELDGHPQYRPIAGTPLHFVANSPTPIIRVEPRSFLALQAGVWFEATSVIGPWQVAGSVPAVVYSIPANSPLHYVTYVRIYSTTPQVVEAGYTAGYTGALVTADGVVVYGTGYNYPPWIGERYFPAPATYGIAPPNHTAAGACNGGNACCPGGATRNVYAYWGNAVYSGARPYPHESHAGRAGEGYAAAGLEGDHYADVQGNVYRSTASGWEKQTGNRWESVGPTESVWASHEQQARVAGADRFKCFRERGGADRYAEDRSGAGDRVGNSERSGAADVRVGSLRSRRGGP